MYPIYALQNRKKYLQTKLQNQVVYMPSLLLTIELPNTPTKVFSYPHNSPGESAKRQSE